MARPVGDNEAGARPDVWPASGRSIICYVALTYAVLLGALAVVWCDGQVRINRYAEQIATNEREISAMMAALRDLQASNKRQEIWNEAQKEFNLATARWMVEQTKRKR